MSDPATNENLREGRRERGDFGKDQGVGMKKGWTAVPLGELCDVLDNKRKPITKRDRETGEYPYYGATGIKDYVSGYIFDEPLVLVGEDGAKWASGDQTAFAIEGKCWVNNHAHVLRPHRTRLIDNWLIHFFFYSDLSEFVSGLTVPKLNQGNLREILIPLPPLAEQQRIVGLLDEAFEGLATAKVNAEKNLQNARALFESHLQSVFTQRGKGWVEKRLGDVCELFQGLCINAKTKHLLVEKSSLPLLRIKDLRSNSAEQFIAETGWPKNAHVSADEIIYTRTGQIGLVFRGRVGVLHNNCFKVRPKPVLNSDYLFWWLQNPEFRARITTLASKAAQPDITHSLFKVQPIQIPPRDYQDKAIAVIDEMREETQRLARLYERKHALLTALKKSLLHQAFTGAL